MDISTALAQAKAHGWSDDSQWTPSFIAHQVSAERQGYLAAVTVRTDGAIHWAISSLTGKMRGRRGSAPSLPAAMTACEAAVSAQTGTLF